MGKSIEEYKKTDEQSQSNLKDKIQNIKNKIETE